MALTEQQQVANLYRSVLGRDPDEGGLAAYTNALKTGTHTISDIVRDFNAAIASGAEAGPQTAAPAAPVAPVAQPASGFDINKLITENLQASSNRLNQVANYQPQQVTAQSYTPAQISQADLSQYMNPYTQEVIDTTLADLERSRQMTANNLGFAATRAGAFGGSRHGIAEAETNRAYADQAARTSAGLRQSGFGQALATAGQDIGAQNAALQANANMAMNAQQLNQAAGLSGAQLGLSAAGAQGNLANLGFGMQNTVNQTMFNQGLAQQQMNQQLINNAMQQYNAMTNYPSSSLGYMGQALGVFPNMGTTTQTSNPGLFNYLSMGLGAYGMLR